jgi:hypothetical protein
MIKKSLLILAIVSLLTECKKDTISTTGNIEFKCEDDYFIGAKYSVHTEYDFFNNNNRNGNFSLKSGTIAQTTLVNDLNPGNYVIYFFKENWSTLNIYKTVQVTAGQTRSYSLSLYNH